MMYRLSTTFQKTQKTNRLNTFHEYWKLSSLHVFQILPKLMSGRFQATLFPAATILVLAILVKYII